MSGLYDPNCETTNEEKVVAGHWECLRRNEEFQKLSRRWLQSEVFRQSHALSPDYHDMQHHTPRCAWDWMLTAVQRVRLAGFQIEKLRWLVDHDFNFGPLICRENFSASAVTSKNWREFLQVEPLPDAPLPIRVTQSWDCTPELFKKQFRLAYASTNEFGEINERLDELANLIRIAASKLAVGDPLKETPIIKQVDHNGTGENTRYGDTFTDDQFPGETFDYLLANPPFGVDWKKQADVIAKEQKLGFSGRFGAGVPRVNDGSLLFLQHMVSKFEPVQPEQHKHGSRLAIVFNGSPLFTGGAGQRRKRHPQVDH